MKEKEKNIYGIHQYTLTRRRKIRGKKRKIKRKTKKKENKNQSELMCVKLFTPLSCKERKEK